MTTVGFGDQYPRTTQGYIVGCVCMLCGILLISLPVAIVGSKFQEAYEDMEDAQFAEAVASLQTDQDGAIDFAKMAGKLKGAKGQANSKKGPKLPEAAKRMADLRQRLEELQAADMPDQVSPSAKQIVRELLELFDKNRKIDANIALLKEKDFRLQKSITKGFDEVSLILRAGKNSRGKKNQAKPKEDSANTPNSPTSPSKLNPKK